MTMSISERIKQQVNNWMEHNFMPVLGDKELIQLLRARFDDLDVAPKDGVIHISEIQAIKTSPPETFTDKDIAMLELIEKYYHLLKEFHDDDTSEDRGITREDLDTLENCLQEACSNSLLKELDSIRRSQ